MTGGSAQYFGLDVTPDGKTMLLGGLGGSVFELLEKSDPSVIISMSGENVVLSWPASLTNMIIQSTSDLSMGFADLDPQPAVVIDGEMNTAAIAVSAGVDRAFFRLRQ